MTLDQFDPSNTDTSAGAGKACRENAVTDKNFIFYFEFDDLSSDVRILVIFFGGANHRQQIMGRLRT